MTLNGSAIFNPPHHIPTVHICCAQIFADLPLNFHKCFLACRCFAMCTMPLKFAAQILLQTFCLILFQLREMINYLNQIPKIHGLLNLKEWLTN